MNNQKFDIDEMFRVHKLEKTNLTTRSNSKGMWDEYKCSRCGATFKRPGLESYVISTTPYYRSARDKDVYCDGTFTEACKHLVGKKIWVIHCHGMGGLFNNLKEDTIHAIIQPPPGYLNDAKGVWVMGNGEPVKLLFGEFFFIPIVKIRKNGKNN